jgi:hypothetical protein
MGPGQVLFGAHFRAIMRRMRLVAMTAISRSAATLCPWRARHSRSEASLKTTWSILLLVSSLLACKHGSKETAEDTASQAKEIARCQKVLKTLASLGDKMKGAAPTEMKESVLKGTRNGLPNFDVLLDKELSAPEELPKVPIAQEHYFAKCAKHVQAKTVSITDCYIPYVVVLKPRTFTTAAVSGNEYTPGKIDADAYVFDLSNGELIGGGRVQGTTPDKHSTTSSNAEYELAEKLGQSTFDSIVQTLNVGKK